MTKIYVGNIAFELEPHELEAEFARVRLLRGSVM